MRRTSFNYTALIHLVLGGLLLLWTSAFILKLIAFIVGILLINSGITQMGYRGLSSYISQIAMRGMRGF
ncbi:hypothetical protein Noda2021_01710 [Candidatus Dependentiae bacterium Noda2021]|nr:hypothetical protein Noda2021_01710 [Candidatus Dependentiae bacterium Noda2021]